MIFWASIVLAIIISVGAQQECSVCGDGQAVAAPDVIFSSPGEPVVSCGMLEQAGKDGQIPAAQCPLLVGLITDVCQCGPIQESTMAPFGPNFPPAPTNAPIVAPVTIPVIPVTMAPIVELTIAPIVVPTAPVVSPTDRPSVQPNNAPSTSPVRAPSSFPVMQPIALPTPVAGKKGDKNKGGGKKMKEKNTAMSKKEKMPKGKGPGLSKKSKRAKTESDKVPSSEKGKKKPKVERVADKSNKSNNSAKSVKSTKVPKQDNEVKHPKGQKSESESEEEDETLHVEKSGKTSKKEAAAKPKGGRGKQKRY